MSKTGQLYIAACPVGCRSNLVMSDIILPEGPLNRCPICGQLVFQCDKTYYKDSINKFNDPDVAYQWSKSSNRYIKRSQKTLKRLRRLLGKDFKNIRLLDVGCASGAFIKIANKLGVHAEGVEPMAFPARAATASGLKVTEGYLEDLNLPEESFDVVTLFEVIEHLKNPVSLLKECRRILRPGGLMIVKTGNTDSWTVRYMKERWDYFCPAIGHISFFNPRSMKVLAERTGFTIGKICFHSVSLFRKEDVSFFFYRTIKILADLLNLPSKLLGKSHEMEVYLLSGLKKKSLC